MNIELPMMQFRLVGNVPLLMHNERLANPMDPAQKRLKALTSKRKKTDEDFAELARAEFDGGLYINDDGAFIPDHWILAMMRDAAKQIKLGKAVTQGVMIFGNEFPLEVKGVKPKATADDLWNAKCYDQRMVGNQSNRVLRTRPKFEHWAVNCEVYYDPGVFDKRQLDQILQIGGLKIGLGDYRPRFGRFSVE